jgi:hypothetical protein
MAFRQHTHTHSMDNNFAIGKGQMTGGDMYANQGSPTISQQKSGGQRLTVSQKKEIEAKESEQAFKHQGELDSAPTRATQIGQDTGSYSGPIGSRGSSGYLGPFDYMD